MNWYLISGFLVLVGLAFVAIVRWAVLKICELIDE
jgi:hypothetical protein